MIRRGLAVALLSAALVAAACGVRQPATATPQRPHAAPPAPEPTLPPKAFVAAMNRFGRETWSKMRVNVASPMALALAVSTLESGARGNTRTAIAKVLHLPASGSEPAHWWRQWLAWTAADRRGPHPVLDLRTRLWVNRGFPVEPGFQTLLRESYAADWTTVDLAHHADDERQRLIRWLERGTGGTFPETSVRLYADHGLLVYTTFGFSACWQRPFDPGETAPGQFFPAPHLATGLPMMHGAVRGYYGKTHLMQMARIPLAARTNAHWELFIFLPKPYRFRDGVLEPVVRSGLAAMARKLEPAVVELTLPKFRLQPEFEEVYSLRSGPMRTAFANGADLSGIAKGVKLDEILWGGRTSMDEFGIGRPGPCAPGGRRVPTGGEKLSRVVLKLDRGFLFAVRDAVSGVVVLMGTYGVRKHHLVPL